MKKSVDFVKTTTIGGLVAIVPLAVLGLIIAAVVPVVIDVAKVLGEFLPFDPVTNLLLALTGAIVLLVVICFVAGLAVMTGPGEALRRRVDRLLERAVPLYGAARKLAERVTGAEGEDFHPVAVDLYGSDTRTLGVLVERVPGDRCAVFVPLSPTAAVGSVYVLPASRVELMDATLPEAFGVIGEWGVGASKLYLRATPSTDDVEATGVSVQAREPLD